MEAVVLEWVRFLDYFLPYTGSEFQTHGGAQIPKYVPPLVRQCPLESFYGFRVTSPPGRLATRKLAIKRHLVASGDFSEDL